MVVDKKSKKILCTAFAKGRKHDFRLFKESKLPLNPRIQTIVDTGYLGICKIHLNAILPKKRSKKNPLTQDDKLSNHLLSSRRVLNEHVIGELKRFKIIADKYRNRRKRFGLRFNLISGIYNWQLSK